MAGSIPLLCCICPKTPHFSDLSHLLTHLGSKGHLAHKNNTELRAASDPDEREKLHRFDAWSQRYGVQRLLAQRVKAQDARRNSRHASMGRAQTRALIKNEDDNLDQWQPDTQNRSPAKLRTKRSRQKLKRSTTRPTFPKTEPVIDPCIIIEAHPRHSATDVPESASGLDTRLAARRSRQFVPRMSEAAEKDNARSALQQAEIQKDQDERLFTSPGDVSQTSDDYDQYLQILAPYDSALKKQRSTCEIESHSGDPDQESVKSHTPRCHGPPVLKGIRWPGMALFDSASQDVQRLRNQKKDKSVLQQMINDSAAIEPIELIYWPEWDLKKARVITGQVESSPPPEEQDEETDDAYRRITPPPSQLMFPCFRAPTPCVSPTVRPQSPSPSPSMPSFKRYPATQKPLPYNIGQSFSQYLEEAANDSHDSSKTHLLCHQKPLYPSDALTTSFREHEARPNAAPVYKASTKRNFQVFNDPECEWNAHRSCLQRGQEHPGQSKIIALQDSGLSALNRPLTLRKHRSSESPIKQMTLLNDQRLTIEDERENAMLGWDFGDIFQAGPDTLQAEQHNFELPAQNIVTSHIGLPGYSSQHQGPPGAPYYGAKMINPLNRAHHQNRPAYF